CGYNACEIANVICEETGCLQLSAKMASGNKFFKRQLQMIIKCCIQAGVPSPSQFPTNVSYEVRIEGKGRTIYNVYSLGPRNVVEIKLDSRWFKPKQQEASKEKKSLKRKRDNVPDSKNRERGHKRQTVNAPNSRKKKRETNVVDNIPTENQEENCNGNSNGEGEQPTNGNNVDFTSNNERNSAEGKNQENKEDINSRPTYTLPLRVKYNIGRYALFQIFGHHLDWQRLLHDIESNIADLEWDFQGQKYPLSEDKEEGGNGKKLAHPEDGEEGGSGQKFPLTDDGGRNSHHGGIPFPDDVGSYSHCVGIPFPHDQESNGHCGGIPFPDDKEGKSHYGVIPLPDGEEGNRHPVLIPFRNSHSREMPFQDDEDGNSHCGGIPLPNGEEGNIRHPVLIPFHNSGRGVIPSYGLAPGVEYTSGVAGDGLDEDEDEDEEEDDDEDEDEDTSFDLITPHLPLPRNVSDNKEWCSICHNCNPEVDDSLNRLLLPCSHAYHP
ncbi:hypothetical protein KI387_035448, partial [Taxus chinensis]